MKNFKERNLYDYKLYYVDLLACSCVVAQGGAKKRPMTTVTKVMPNVSQGSVSTHLKCGRNFSNDFITNLLVSQTAKEFKIRSANLWRIYRRE